MKLLKVAVITTIALLVTACGGTQECREPQRYEQARLSQPVQVPDGLDALDPSREMTIPEPSPREPRPADAPCLEYPPTILIRGSETATESETATGSAAPEATQ